MNWSIVLAAVCALHSTMLLAAPSFESCPHDSHFIEDTCKCNPNSCEKPPCLFDLQITVNGSDIPGKCCPIYSCEGCDNSTMFNDQCPCALGATLNDANKCVCVDPHKTLIGNECVCDEDKCPLPDLCDAHSVPVQETKGCCTTTKCIKCPDDSYSTQMDDPRIEDKCVCYPCTKKCKANEKINVIHRGSGFPGSCCDIYQCEEKKVCEFNGDFYNIGTNWTAPNGEKCECKFNGIAFCMEAGNEQKLCYQEGNVYHPNESWMVDSCTNCSCINGEIKCIAHMCDIRPSKKLNCPQIKCNKSCPHGFKTTKLGCPTCKCNATAKYGDILNKYNITEEELDTILKEHFGETSSATQSTIPVTNTTMHPPTGQESPSPEIMIPLAIIIVVIFVVGIVTCFCLKRKSKKGSYDTCPPAEPPATSEERLWNNNNNMVNLKENSQSIRGFYRRKLGEILWRKCSP